MLETGGKETRQMKSRRNSLFIFILPFGIRARGSGTSTSVEASTLLGSTMLVKIWFNIVAKGSDVASSSGLVATKG